ncbi:MAG: zinc ribbon domain-containing protein [Candidatus Hodarchaeota archaeon]
MGDNANFKCRNENCKGILVPLQLREDKKNDEIDLSAKCPKCKKITRFSLSLDKEEVKQWNPMLVKQFFTCPHCGDEPLKTIDIAGNEKWDFMLKVECLACKKESKKYIDGDLFSLLKSDLPAPRSMDLKCPICNKKIDASDKTCPNCGKEILCSNCDALIPLGAKFCIKCADPVEQGEIPHEPLIVQKDLYKECVTCGNDIEEGEIICNICGQEIKCDKCGKPIITRAVYCQSCGDKVRLGLL